MKRIVISGYYGLGNIGDEAVLAGIIASFRAANADVEIMVHSADPPATRALHGVEAVPRYSGRLVIDTIRKADLLLSGGGSLLQDVTSARSAAYYFGIILLAELLRTPVMMYAQGVGPITRPITALQARLLLNRVNLATVRDDDSAELLRRLGVRKPPIHVTADPSFAFDPAGSAEVDTILAEASEPSDRPLLGVAVRPWKVEGDWSRALAEGLTQAADRIGATVVFLPMQNPTDAALAEEIASQIPVESIVLRSPLSPAQAKGVVGRMGAMIAMRLHALMFAASEAVPAVALSYDPKVTSFARNTQAHMPTLDAISISPDEVASSVEMVWANRTSIQASLQARRQEWREKAIHNSRLALDLLSL